MVYARESGDGEGRGAEEDGRRGWRAC